MTTNQIPIEGLNARFQKAQPEEVIRWAVGEFRPRLAATSSFQTESVALLHMISQVEPNLPILFLETGWHFPETLAFKKEMIRRLKLTNVTDLKADPVKREALHKESAGEPYRLFPDRCCQINKVEPLERALKNYDAWLSGIRRSQSRTREDISIVEQYPTGLIKINPLANFTSGDIFWYLRRHDLPRHPLFEKGYLSIGCRPCTKPVQPGDDERSGRWAGLSKTECGIHTFMKPVTGGGVKKEAPETKEEGGGI